MTNDPTTPDGATAALLVGFEAPAVTVVAEVVEVVTRDAPR